MAPKAKLMAMKRTSVMKSKPLTKSKDSKGTSPTSKKSPIVKKPTQKKIDVAEELFGDDDSDTMTKRPSAATDGDDDTGKLDKYPTELREWKKKKREFDRAESIGFPPHVIDGVEKARNMKGGGKREAMNKIVNDAVQMQSNGKYRLVIKAPVFEQWRTKYDDKYGKDQTIGETLTYASQLAGRLGANRKGFYRLVKKF